MLTWLASGFTLLSMWLTGKKLVLGWVVCVIAQVCWIIFALRIGNPGLLFIEVVVVLFAFWNIWQWRK